MKFSTPVIFDPMHIQLVGFRMRTEILEALQANSNLLSILNLLVINGCSVVAPSMKVTVTKVNASEQNCYRHVFT
jgi:hypothetical protein